MHMGLDKVNSKAKPGSQQLIFTCPNSTEKHIENNTKC